MSLSRCCSRILTKPKEEEEEEHNKVEDAIVICLRRSSSFPIRTNSAQSLWSKFPEDIIIEILCRLPETDLIASKFVSKDWNFVISRVCLPRLCPPYPSAPFCGVLCFEDPPPPKGGDDPDPNASADKYLKLQFAGVSKYINRVFGRQKQQGRSTIIDHIMNLLPSSEHDPSDIQDCCNGLLLLASDSQYYVGNPTTKQSIAISVNPNIHNCRDVHSSLVFDPSISLNFKIVSFIRPAVNATIIDPMGLDIFSSETGEWSCHILPLEPQSLYGFEWIRRAVYFNGAL